MKHPEWYKPIDRKIYYQKFLKAVNTADKIVAISKNTKNDIVEYSNIAPEKIEVIYQVCHQVFKQPVSDKFKKSIKEKYNLPDNFLLNVGTIEPRKNAFTIVKSIRQTNYHLVLVGRQTKYTEEIIKYIHQHNMYNQITFLQGLTLEELATVYQMADIFIYPSKYEGFGIPIIEALYSKTPVITNKYGVFSEAGGEYSYYLNDVNDEIEMRKIIDLIYQNKDQNRILAAYDFVQQFNDDVIAEKWMNLYQKLSKN
jgi:glycosyltransferase involved in cell wall biosynthesis